MDFRVLQDCMYQINFMNCPEKIYHQNAEAYEKGRLLLDGNKMADVDDLRRVCS